MPEKATALLGYYITSKLHIQYKYQIGEILGMVDYKDIGKRIKVIRKQRKMTQERLAEAAGVGTTHISHIETGQTIPSLQTLIDIINALECSADELLCIEVSQARPFLNNWLTELVADCSSLEIKIISDMVGAMKDSMRRLHIGEE